MSRRRPTYRAYIADKMRNLEFAQGLVLVAVEDGASVEDAVRMAVESAGLKEFSERSGIPLQHLSSFARGEKKFGQKRLERCLDVFDLKLSVAKKSHRKAA